MMAYLRWCVCITLLALGACERKNDIDPDVPTPCAVDGECTEAGKEVCDLAASDGPVCVQCTPERAGACKGTTPVCGADSKACRGCAAHAECSDSVVCEAAGSCADKAKVLYAAPVALSMDCTKESPCSLATALGKVTATLNTIKLAAGTYMVNLDLNGDQNNLSAFTLNMLAEPGTMLQALVAGTPVLRLHKSAKLALSDVELSGSTAETVKMESGAALTLTRGKVVGGSVGVDVDNSNLTLDRSVVSGGSAQGIRVDKAMSRVTIEQSQILVSGGPGISVIDGELVLSRSLVRGNIGGGVVVASMRKVTITNNFIVGNTGAGGIRAPDISTASKIDLNTISGNLAGAGATAAGGIVCDRSGLTLTGNIVFRNVGGPNGAVQVLGNCMHANSLVLAGTAPEAEHPKFVSETDYHLMATGNPATVVNALSGASCSGVDYDGDTRPQGAGCELGADELKQ